MKSRHWFLIAACISMIVATACGIIACLPAKDDVRIPMRRANGNMGYIDSSGKMAIGAVWATAMPFGPDGQALVSTRRDVSKLEMWFARWIPGFRRYGGTRETFFRIDRSGNRTPCEPPASLSWEQPAERPPKELTLVERTGFSWILADGSPAFPGSWSRAIDFKDRDPAAVLEKGRWGFIDRRGQTIIPNQWDDTRGFDGHGRACVSTNHKWGVIDIKARLVVPLHFESLAGFDGKDMCCARLASGWGYIDPEGKILIPFRYRRAEAFDRFDMAKVGIGGNHGGILYGWIDRRGNPLTPLIYHADLPVWASNFTDHELLPVIGPDGEGLIDRNGRTVIATAHGELQAVEDPAAPGKFWITTAPYRSASGRPGVWRPPFTPACYDSSGKLIWSDDAFESKEIFIISAAAFAMLAALLFALGMFQQRAPADRASPT